MSSVVLAALVLMVAAAAIYAVIVYNGLVHLQNEMGRGGPISMSCSNSVMTRFRIWWLASKDTWTTSVQLWKL